MQKTDMTDYRPISVIGQGAFSVVYLVEGEGGRRYACKESRETKMLEREAGILGGLCHPLFPTYVDYGEKDGVGRLFMEYIPGRNLGQLLRLRGGFSVRQTVRIAGELTEGLRYLHERQPAVLYRDLKPENIMVCGNGRVKLIDFGCACHQGEGGGVKAGTPGFAPPEQLSGEGAAGIYSDVYGLGRTLQSLMAGRDAPGGGGQRYRRRLERLIKECTNEDFRRRPQDMVSVARMLKGKRGGETGILCEKNIWESSHKNSCSLPSI